MTDINNLFDALKSELKKEDTVKSHFDKCFDFSLKCLRADQNL